MTTRKQKDLTSLGLLKVPPQSIEAEQAVLGSILLTPAAWDRVADILTPSDFYRENHRRIFEAMGDLYNRSRVCDAVTVTEWFESHGLIELVEGGDYLVQLAGSTPSAANVIAYATIVREKSTLRGLLEAASRIVEGAYSLDGRTAEELVEDAERRIFAIADSQSHRGPGFVRLRDVTGNVLQLLEERTRYADDITGLATGFRDFDKLTAGLQKSDLIVVAGRPSMGKTAFAMNIAEHAALRDGKSVAVFSMEMSAAQLVTRLIASHGKISQDKLRTPRNLGDLEWPRVSNAILALNQCNIFIDETPALSPVELRSRARRLKHEHDLDLIVVDYLQLMHVPGSLENRATVIAEISGSLKALAKELDIPVIAISQLNRQLEKRQDRRPVMSDLRESGSIEQDADLIVFIYREAVYDKILKNEGKAEAIIGKHRNGETGTIPLHFDGRWVSFSNFAPEAYYSE